MWVWANSGSGPTVDLRRDGLRVKDTRDGAGAEPVTSSPSDDDAMANTSIVTSTRQWYDIDRNSRITLQRILYALTALPLLNAHLSGTWDVIGGVVVLNSYYIIAAAVFVASQFMGTSQRSNAVKEEE